MSGIVSFQFAQDSIQNNTFIEGNWLPLDSKSLVFPDLKMFACHELRRKEPFGSALVLAAISLSCSARHRVPLSPSVALHYVGVAGNCMAWIAGCVALVLLSPAAGPWAVTAGRFHGTASPWVLFSARPWCARRVQPLVPPCSCTLLTLGISLLRRISPVWAACEKKICLTE